MHEQLNHLRDSLLALDTHIVKLLNERAEISIAIGTHKKSRGLPVYDPGRENEVISSVMEENTGPLSPASLRQIYREILSVSRALQKPMNVAYLGPEASFTHMAVQSHFGDSIELSAQSTVHDVFEEVEKARSAFGVVPVENSLEGSVKQTLDKLVSTPLSIMGDIYLPIRHCLLSAQEKLETVKRVHSHPQALAQCGRWLRNNLPRASLYEEESTAAAAGRILSDKEAAAIASKTAASIYGLTVIAEGIEEHPANITRFLIIGNSGNQPTGRDKTSIVFGVRHKPGALLRALAPFSRRNVNLTKIVSHPLRDRIWEYLFFVDFEGHAAGKDEAACLKQLEEAGTFVKILGSYPMGEIQP
ncbi:MAG: prephenate dehydratase [Syntrophales bacterium]|jgi:chorismate mutase/prephenate dehydratase|nr:prephenate dehydratase [Syntrophales bacterium]MDY0043228.1 prephenate dehydratase [Syntrophales bacterium]